MKLWKITLEDERVYLVGGERNVKVVDSAEHLYGSTVVEMEYIGKVDLVVV